MFQKKGYNDMCTASCLATGVHLMREQPSITQNSFWVDLLVSIINCPALNRIICHSFHRLSIKHHVDQWYYFTSPWMVPKIGCSGKYNCNWYVIRLEPNCKFCYATTNLVVLHKNVRFFLRKRKNIRFRCSDHVVLVQVWAEQIQIQFEPSKCEAELFKWAGR